MDTIIIPDFRLANYIIEKFNSFSQYFISNKPSVINPTYSLSSNCLYKPQNASGNFKIMKRRPIESKWLAQGHPVNGWQSPDMNPSLPIPLLLLQYIGLSPDSHFSSYSLRKQGRQCSDRSCLRAILIALLFCWRNTDAVICSPWSLQPGYCSGSHQMLLLPGYLKTAKLLRTAGRAT